MKKLEHGDIVFYLPIKKQVVISGFDKHNGIVYYYGYYCDNRNMIKAFRTQRHNLTTKISGNILEETIKIKDILFVFDKLKYDTNTKYHLKQDFNLYVANIAFYSFYFESQRIEDTILKRFSEGNEIYRERKKYYYS